MRNTNPDESPDAEGLPDLEGHPPGMDVELDQESMMVPRDHPVAAGDDPAYPTTAAEERLPEGVVERAARENPDFGAEELGVGGGIQGARARRADDTLLETDLPADAGMAFSAEEAAVRVRSDADEL